MTGGNDNPDTVSVGENLEEPTDTEGVSGVHASVGMVHAAGQGDPTPPATEPPAASQDQQDNAEAPPAPYSLGSNRTRDYSHRLSHAMDDPISTKAYEPANEATQLTQITNKGASKGTGKGAPHPFVGMLFQQMSARAGYRRFGDAARDATRHEFK